MLWQMETPMRIARVYPIEIPMDFRKDSAPMGAGTTYLSGDPFHWPLDNLPIAILARGHLIAYQTSDAVIPP